MGAVVSSIPPAIAATFADITALVYKLIGLPTHDNETNKANEEQQQYEKEKKEIEMKIQKKEEELRAKQQEHERLQKEMKAHQDKMAAEEKKIQAEKEKLQKEFEQKKKEEEKYKQAEKERLQKEFEQKKEEDEKKMQQEKKEHEEKMKEEYEQKLKDEEERRQRENREHEEQIKKKQEEEVERLQKDYERKQKEELERLEQEKQEYLEHVERERKAEYLRMQREQARMESEFNKREAEQKAIEEELHRRHAEREELLQAHVRQLEKGISPKVWPTDQEWIQAQARLLGGREKFHCAVAGNSGSGKSSLINALRGVRNGKEAAAAVGVVETTDKISAYLDPSLLPPRNRFVWYDVPGAGTLNTPGPQYFNSMGLFVFDLIIVVVDIRLTAQDIAILQNCQYFKIPSFIVRSKANQHINNIIDEELPEDGDSEGESSGSELMVLKKARRFEEAKKRLVLKTNESYRKNLADGELNPNQKVYIVSAGGVRSLVSLGNINELGHILTKFKNANYLIDEGQLIKDLLKAIVARRYDGEV